MNSGGLFQAVGVMTAGVCIALAASSCSRPDVPQTESALPVSSSFNGQKGRTTREPSPWVAQFLEDYLLELNRSIDPGKLQAWAVEVLATLGDDEAHRRIVPEQIPEEFLDSPLKRSLISITAVNQKGTEQSHVIFLSGSGRGFYGVEVGDAYFSPSDDRANRRQWSSGVYVYFLPPL